MGNSEEVYGGPDRRKNVNADLRARLDEVARKLSHNPKLTEDDLRQLYLLMRHLYWSGLGSSRSSDLLELVKEEYAGELNPAMLALLDDVMGSEVYDVTGVPQKDKLLQRLTAGWGSLSEEKLAQIEKVLEE